MDFDQSIPLRHYSVYSGRTLQLYDTASFHEIFWSFFPQAKPFTQFRFFFIFLRRKCSFFGLSMTVKAQYSIVSKVKKKNIFDCNEMNK